ncbi:MAG: acyltransferase, partial [Candidatus Limnocylindrales bacterium]
MIAPPERGEHFRPDVEGLRALAVVLVLLYHANVPFFGGGYVGVDVFFVISGFLITGLLLRELDSTGRLSFSGFYARRVRRLLPASALTLLVTLVAAVLLLSPVRMPDVAADIASAGAYISNFRFGLAANDYFAANAAPSPVIHFWSLSVEEQFYFVWPTVLAILFAISRRLRVGRRGLLIGMALLSAVSLLAGIWLTGVNQAWAFYLLPTRAWELGAGALLAISAGHVRLPGRRPAVLMSTVGLAAVALAALLFTDQTAFPGYAALLPVVGTALVIFGGTRSETLPTRLLSLPPCTFLGGISYSVYLWHWPMLLFAGVVYGATLPLPLAALVALASIPVAAVTQRLVEKPFRAGRFIGTRARFNLSQAVASTLVIALLAGAASVYARGRVD